MRELSVIYCITKTWRLSSREDNWTEMTALGQQGHIWCQKEWYGLVLKIVSVHVLAFGHQQQITNVEYCVSDLRPRDPDKFTFYISIPAKGGCLEIQRHVVIWCNTSANILHWIKYEYFKGLGFTFSGISDYISLVLLTYNKDPVVVHVKCSFLSTNRV